MGKNRVALILHGNQQPSGGLDHARPPDRSRRHHVARASNQSWPIIYACCFRRVSSLPSPADRSSLARRSERSMQPSLPVHARRRAQPRQASPSLSGALIAAGPSTADWATGQGVADGMQPRG
ncbi:hypothetical protein ZWY2020_055560 [Hordeum vulgare]|nr:hypothetical protein ZWY2020_055560 [Hordeum vulgare]